MPDYANHEFDKEWLFGSFWLAINMELAKRGLPEMGYKGAREAWDASLNIGRENPVR